MISVIKCPKCGTDKSVPYEIRLYTLDMYFVKQLSYV